MNRHPKEPVRPIDVLVDLLAGGDFDHQILDAAESARLIIERLRDEGYEITPIRRKP